MGLDQVLAYMLQPLAWCFVGLLSVGTNDFLTLLSSLGTLFLQLSCVVLLDLVLCFVVVFWKHGIFLRETKGAWIWGRGEMKGVPGGSGRRGNYSHGVLHEI